MPEASSKRCPGIPPTPSQGLICSRLKSAEPIAKEDALPRKPMRGFFVSGLRMTGRFSRIVPNPEGRQTRQSRYKPAPLPAPPFARLFSDCRNWDKSPVRSSNLQLVATVTHQIKLAWNRLGRCQAVRSWAVR